MKFKMRKILLLVPMMVLSGCGYGLKEIYQGDVYVSVDYNKNFYGEWDETIKKVEEDNKDQPAYVLNKDNDNVFTSFNDENFVHVQPDADKYSYESDLNEPSDPEKKSYGQTYALGNIDSSFKYGYLSKLFNGQMFCHSTYELARVQIDENGFGTKFSKEIKEYDYFALNFKASLDYRRDGASTNIPGHMSSINLQINFYCKTDNQSYRRVPVSYQIDNIPTNAGEKYIFFGFDLAHIDISRLAGISVQYTLVDDTIKNEQPEMNWKHCLLLYELFLPNSTWH